MGLIFAEFATSLKLPKIDTVKNKSYYTSPFRVRQIAKIGLDEVLAKISRCKEFLIYGTCTYFTCFCTASCLYHSIPNKHRRVIIDHVLLAQSSITKYGILRC